MKKLFFIYCFISAITFATTESPYMQCAVNHVGSSGVRLDLFLDAGDVSRAVLTFGKNGTEVTYTGEFKINGFEGAIPDNKEHKLKLIVSGQEQSNLNIIGFGSRLNASYLNNGNSIDVVEENLVCGEKISADWN